MDITFIIINERRFSGRERGQRLSWFALEGNNSAQFSADGQRVVTASFDKTARVWDAATGKAISEPMRHDGGLYSAQFSADGQRVVTASDDKTAQVWDVATAKAISKPMRHDGGVYS